MRVATGLLVLLALSAPQAHSQGKGTLLHATVADASTGVFILDAEVTVKPLNLRRLTDYLGDARFAGIPRGVFTVEARRMGYAPLSTQAKFTGHDSLDVTLLLVPASQALPTVTVSETASPPFLREFDDRRRQGKGYYVTFAELRESHGRSIEDIVVRKFPGMRIGGPAGARIPYSTRGTHSVRKATCAIAVYYNGVRTGTEALSIDLNLIGGIEYYSAAFVPIEYRVPGNDCGVMLLWPRPPLK